MSERRWMIALMLFECALLILCAPDSGLHFDSWNLVLTISAFGVLLRPGSRVWQVGGWRLDFALLLAFTTVTFPLTYVAAGWGGELIDTALVEFDAAMGFDWRAYSAVFLHDPILRSLSLLLYFSTPVLVLAVVFVLHRNPCGRRAAQFMFAITAGALCCIALSVFFPSAGGAGYFMPDADYYRGYKVFVDAQYMQRFFELRDGRGMLVKLWQPYGLISFPSYHACVSVCVALALWADRRRCWWIIAIALASLLVIPVEGGHHLSDTVAGAGLGFILWVVSSTVIRSDPRSV